MKKTKKVKYTSFEKFKRILMLKLRNIDKLKLLDFILNENRWVKIEIN